MPQYHTRIVFNGGAHSTDGPYPSVAAAVSAARRALRGCVSADYAHILADSVASEALAIVRREPNYSVDRVACGHSACRQNWIETGELDCVEGTA